MQLFQKIVNRYKHLLIIGGRVFLLDLGKTGRKQVKS